MGAHGRTGLICTESSTLFFPLSPSAWISPWPGKTCLRISDAEKRQELRVKTGVLADGSAKVPGGEADVRACTALRCTSMRFIKTRVSGKYFKDKKTLEMNFRNLRQFSSRRRCHALLPTQLHLQAACWFILSLSFPGPGSRVRRLNAVLCRSYSVSSVSWGSVDTGRRVAEHTESFGLNPYQT